MPIGKHAMFWNNSTPTTKMTTFYMNIGLEGTTLIDLKNFYDKIIIGKI